MTEIDILRFHPRHVEVMDMRDIEKGFFNLLDGSIEKIDLMSKSSVEAVTLMFDGRVIACSGFIKLWPGVAELWTIPSIYIPENPRLYSRMMRAFVEDIARACKFHRLQTTAPADKLHEKWMKWLGFEKEGTLKQYTHDKQDHHQYARLF